MFKYVIVLIYISVFYIQSTCGSFKYFQDGQQSALPKEKKKKKTNCVDKFINFMI